MESGTLGLTAIIILVNCLVCRKQEEAIASSCLILAAPLNMLQEYKLKINNNNKNKKKTNTTTFVFFCCIGLFFRLLHIRQAPHRSSTEPFEDCWCGRYMYFTGRIFFLSPTQQHQSIEGIKRQINVLNLKKLPAVLFVPEWWNQFWFVWQVIDNKTGIIIWERIHLYD